MRKIVFDLETKNMFQDVGGNDPALLDMSLVGIYDSETNTYKSYLQEELPQLWPILERADLLIGYNSDHFDIPLLNKYYGGDLTAIPSLDILAEVKKVLGRRIRLDSVAEGTLGKKKSGDGLQAVRWWKEGDIENIRKYCLLDVQITKEIYDYVLEHKSLKYKDFAGIKEIKIDTREWDKNQKTALTYSLPF